jgi:hypothetical protein
MTQSSPILPISSTLAQDAFIQRCQQIPSCPQEYLSLQDLDSFLADRLFTVVSQGQDRVTFDQLVIAKANCLKVPLPLPNHRAARHHLHHNSCNMIHQVFIPTITSKDIGVFRQLVMRRHPSASTFWMQAGAAW